MAGGKASIRGGLSRGEPSRSRSRAAKARFWRGAVARQRRSGLSVRGYCRRESLSEPSFYAWRAKLARRDDRRPEAATFLPVTVGVAVSMPVEFQLPSGVLIRVPAQDRAALAAVWELVEAPPCSV